MRRAMARSQLSREQKELKNLVHLWLLRVGVLREGTEQEWQDFATSLVIEKYVPIMLKTTESEKAPPQEPRRGGNGSAKRNKKPIIG